MKTKTNLILGIIFLFNAVLAYGQNFSSSPILITSEHIIQSSCNHKAYRLNISLPKNYANTDTVHYPVLYVLDGSYNFTTFFAIRQVLDLGNEVQNVIIVAIDGNVSEADWMANRFNDFTPSANPKQDSLWSKIFNLPLGKLKSGGASLFLTTIQQDIIPYIERNYKTNTSRGLFGHSLGGLFTGYCLLTKPALFQNYAINSPSMWWNKGELMTLENLFVKQSPSLSAHIFISVGALEGNPMVQPVGAFADTLKNHYPNLKITSHVFENETHLSVVAAASSWTLKVLYSR